MLIIARRTGQKIMIGDDIEITITECHRSSVKLAITAPGMPILRGEIYHTKSIVTKALADVFKKP